MHLDVLDLRNFYYRTRLGRVAQRAIRDQMLTFWPPQDTRGQTIVGFGFAVPLLRGYLESARRVIALMPGPQGVMPWPSGGGNVSVLCEETLWPLETGSVDRLVLLHGLETSDRPGDLLAECHRVLGPGGRVLLIVPNRSGLWARRDATPFGFGRPYSQGQLETQFHLHSFQPERHAAALYGPPSERRFWLKSSGLLERYGRRLSSSVAGGVFLAEASKKLQTPGGAAVKDMVRDPLRVLDAVNAPSGPKPA